MLLPLKVITLPLKAHEAITLTGKLGSVQQIFMILVRQLRTIAQFRAVGTAPEKTPTEKVKFSEL